MIFSEHDARPEPGVDRAGESGVTIGVLALQGDVEEHLTMLRRCGVNAIRVRTPEDIGKIDGLIIPGGESTTVGKLMERFGLDVAIRNAAADGKPIFGTCTGMIVLSREIVDSQQARLGLIDLKVLRNAFGRQVDSFEADLRIPELGPDQESHPVRAVFIRAPWIESAGLGVQILAAIQDKGVLARQGPILVSAFHPELTDDPRIHNYFIRMARESKANRHHPTPKTHHPLTKT